ncbi:type II secretion system major pseudopilin GspG [Sulfurimonas sp. HSL3-7]|uniref:type II secretion system major pseudopilin GspG n=1 Tax=Sulfonitrofixus jiaomeiensis TaxID=3131938 RepID=UPI0031F787D6
MSNHLRTSSRRAFSLMELMIVIIILGLLASLVLPNLMGKGEEAKRKLVCVQMKGIGETLKMFKLDNGVYPTTEEGLQALITNPSEEAYPAYAPNAYFEGKNLPKDSWKNEFIYINNGTDFDLISLGADRKEGGEGDAADIRFSECKF